MTEEMRLNPETRENKADPIEILETVARLGAESKKEKRENGEDWLEKRLASLPAPARERIRQREEKLKRLNLTQEQRAEVLEDDIIGIELTYIDQRFVFDGGERILKEQFGKELVRDWTDEMMESGNLEVEDLQRVARLSFDANGLKSVNDLAVSHERGDEYLKRIANVIRNTDSEPYRLLVEAGATEILPMTGGGDEFSVLVMGNGPLDIDKLQHAVESYESEVSTVDCGDLVDFDDTDVMLRFMGVAPADFSTMSSEERAKLEVDFRKEIPIGFRLKASLSGGVGTLDMGLISAIEDPRDSKRLKADETDYDKALSSIMGGLWDVSDGSAMEAKRVFKDSLVRPESSAEELALSRIFSRNMAEREAKKQTTEQGRKIRQAELLISEMSRLSAMRAELGDERYAEAVSALISKHNTYESNN